MIPSTEGLMVSTQDERIKWSLFLLRLGVFIVMFAWTIDKVINPGHAARVFENYFYLKGLGEPIMIAVGVAEIALIIGFLLGIAKRWTYGLVLVFHALSTLSSWKQYTVDINLLFFAAWPMLAACIALYLLRDIDTKFTLSGART